MLRACTSTDDSEWEALEAQAKFVLNSAADDISRIIRDPGSESSIEV